MRTSSLALLVSALFWPLLVSALSDGVGMRAEALGFALGRAQHVAQVPAPIPLTPDAVESFELGPAVADDEQQDEQAAEPLRNSARVSPRLVEVAKKSTVSPATAQPVPKRGLRVRADTVLRLANARAVPQGDYIAAAGKRPEGMRLSGVTALGVGVIDGDVLTSVGGTPAASRQAVVSAVLAARAQRAPVISAVFWRGDEPWQLLVEMPYLDPPAAPSPSPSPSAPAFIARETSASAANPLPN